ncbi:hypothetical protein ACFV9D_28770 [Streptomyces sp. NPDC059875]|uniref:hypothetical protein n=1 Tax=unclassified Streptomyces TaxID=2593676 RepID=UPI00364A1EF0
MATGTARRRGIRLAATLTVVVLALTGFQTSSSGKSRSSGSGGGGCSSSKKKNNDYDYDDASSGGSGGSEYTTEPATPSVSASPSSTVTVEVVDCVEPAQKKRKGKPARKADTTASLRITSRGSFTETYRVTLRFEGGTGNGVDSTDQLVTVGPGESKVFDVKMPSPRLVDRVKNCVVYDVRRTDASATPTSPTSPTSSGSPSPSS